MKIVIALDSFKGALSADLACQSVAQGLLDADPALEYLLRPMADGGEGTKDVLQAARSDSRWVPVEVFGPIPSRPVRAGFVWLAEDQTAIVEMATASGLPLLPPEDRDPMHTTTYGTGQLLWAAAEYGAQRILLTLGGSATIDGGIGAAMALGWRFLDPQGRPIPPVGGYLGEIDRILPPDPPQRLPPIDVLFDVCAPLCGPFGAAHLFGPQKGATPEKVQLLEAGLAHLAECIHRDVGCEVLHLPGAGAAGGLGAGAVAFFQARPVRGITAVMAAARLPEALQGADWCITGEGCFDLQSLQGKVVAGVAEAARSAGVPTVVFAGQVTLEPSAWQDLGIHAVYGLLHPGQSLAESMQHTAMRLRETAAQWVREHARTSSHLA